MIAKNPIRLALLCLACVGGYACGDAKDPVVPEPPVMRMDMGSDAVDLSEEMSEEMGMPDVGVDMVSTDPDSDCVDGDGDGYFSAGNCGSDVDCDDADATVFRNRTVYEDGDGDGFGVNPSVTCIGDAPPAGTMGTSPVSQVKKLPSMFMTSMARISMSNFSANSKSRSS